MAANTDQLSAPWEQFCKEEAQNAAATFLLRVYDYKRQDSGAEGIAEIRFAKKFSAAFEEAVLALPTSCKKDSKDHMLSHQVPKSDCVQFGRRTVVLESLASHLIVGESFSSWKPCRLVIAVDHGNSQIEVYTPPKAAIPSMSFFCFLIETVRTATLLEAPGSHFAFVFKCHKSGEYIFDFESKGKKDEFHKTAAMYCSNKEAVVWALVPPATKDGEAHSSLQHNSNGVPTGTAVGEDCLHQWDSHQLKSPHACRKKGPNECRPLPSNIAGPVTSDASFTTNGMSQQHRSSPSMAGHTDSVHDSLTPLKSITKCSHSSSSSSSALRPISIAAAQSLAISGNHRRKSSAPSLLATPLSQAYNPNTRQDISTVTVDVSRSCSTDALYFNTVPVQIHSDQLTANNVNVSGNINKNVLIDTLQMSRDAVAFGTSQSVPTSQPLDTQSKKCGEQNTTNGSTPVFIDTAEMNEPDSFLAKNDRNIHVGELKVLSQYPWFHGLISRALATELVLAGNDDSSGKYLVRQSESREKDFVLTFNYHNHAKHLRFTLNENGCFIQHLSFDDVPRMLEHFKTSSIPLESHCLTEDAKLTTYIKRSSSDDFCIPTVPNPSRAQIMSPSLPINKFHRSTIIAPTAAVQSEVLHSSTDGQRQFYHSHSSNGSISSLDTQVQLGVSLLEAQQRSGSACIENNYV